MARTPSQRGPFGNWLKREREERYRTQADALADMRRLAGLHIAVSEFAQWESGSRVPKADNPKVERLYEFFGSRPAETETGSVPESDIASALRLQAGAIQSQADAIREMTAEIRMASLAVLGGQEGTATLLADLVRLAGEGRLAELVPLLRPGSDR